MITLNELYEMMAVMIEIGEGKDHKVFKLIYFQMLKLQM